MPDWQVVVVGAGAAGLMAAARAARRGRQTLLLEKNRKPGVKILMSGGTRCNLTHATDARGIVEAYGPSGRFLHSALAALGPQEVVAMLEAEGVPTKVEETGKVFPKSNKAADVLAALIRAMRGSGAELALEEPLEDLRIEAGGFRLVTRRRELTAGRVVLTSGGKSYPGCGTTGDGYRWAAALGHTIVRPRPALVPIRSDAAWLPELKGITIPDVLVRVAETDDTSANRQGGPRRSPLTRGDVLAQRRGSFLFTHFGVSGPVALDVSRAITGHDQPRKLDLVCDFLPEVDEESLAEQLAREAQSTGKRRLGTILAQWTVGRLAEVFLQRAAFAADRRAADLSKAERLRLVGSMKRLAIPVAGTLGFEKAEVTAGGVALDEVDSRTVQSKRVANLYFAGELLDLDGPIGGYNFQAAFSTGWLAGERC